MFAPLLEAVLVPLMTNQLVPPVEPLVTIPITARMEALKSVHDGKMFFEMTREVSVSAERFLASIIGASETWKE